MNASEILKLRLHNSGLSNSPFKSAADAVSHLGAVQAQDFAAAKWALGLHIKNSTDEDIEKAFNEGAILRTHVMRPTWHFVVPEDIRWMLELTAPRVKKLLMHYNRKLNLDDVLFARSNAAIVEALRGHAYLTRQELKAVLTGMGIKTDVQRLAHIIMWAELDGLICSGPRRGRQFYLCAPGGASGEGQEASSGRGSCQARLNYFTSHGPAQLEDFSLVVFTAEYLLRIWSCDVDPRYRGAFLGRLRYVLTPLALIDLLVILPTYAILAFPADHRLLRSLRLLWTFRLLKLSRYSKSLQTIMDVIRAQQSELAMSFSAIIFFMVLSSTVIYFLEHEAQPQRFPDIPATMWWAVLTMTTVGDNFYPITPLGKLDGGLIIILGVATFALPTSILTSGFVEELGRRRVEKEAQEKEDHEDGT